LHGSYIHLFHIAVNLSEEEVIGFDASNLRKIILDSVERGLILNSVERGLNVVEGDAKGIVYHRIKENFGIEKEDIPDRPEEFIGAIRKIFGGGSAIIERAIEKEMADVMSSKPDRVDFGRTSNYLNLTSAAKRRWHTGSF